MTPYNIMLHTTHYQSDIHHYTVTLYRFQCITTSYLGTSPRCHVTVIDSEESLWSNSAVKLAHA